MKLKNLVRLVLPAVLMILSAAILTLAQEGEKSKHNQRPATAPPVVVKPTNEVRVDPAKYSYEFSQPKFYVKHIVLEHDETGHGTITFERLNEDTPVSEPFQFSPTAYARVASLWAALRFLDSDTNYQSDQQYPHLGTMRISMQQGSRKRIAEFNWTHNSNAAALVEEYRKASDQAILIFDLSVARENQPLNAPKLMDAFESLLSRKALSDPQQLLPLLKDISTDEHIPLIARNHALRLIKKIQK